MIRIIDLTGKIAWEGEYTEEMKITANKFLAGIYFVQLCNYQGKIIATEKMVIIE